MLVVYRNTVLSRPPIYVILARNEGPAEDDVLRSKHVEANHM